MEMEAESYLFSGSKLFDVVNVLIDVDPRVDKMRIESRLQSIENSKSIIELIDRALVLLKNYPCSGQRYYEILYKSYLVLGKYSENEIKLFLEERGSLRILGMRIKSLEGLLVFRTILSLSALIIFILFGFFIGNNFLLLAALISLIMFFLPSEILKSRIKRVSKNILNEIPESLDILSSLIKAGLNLDQAINYYSNNYRGEISKLLKIAQIKLYEGKSRKSAYLGIAKLSFCNEFIAKIFVNPGDIIMTGNPTYLGAMQAFNAYGAKMKGKGKD